jgi:uncharacterized cupredoxin-like copper-binding protein
MHPAMIKRVVGVAAFVAVLGACGSSGSSGAAYKEPAGPPVETIKIESGNVFFKPTSIKAKPGIAKLELTNIESGTHDLVIKGLPGFQLEVSGDGSKASGKVDLKPGSSEFYCTIPGHKEAGMKGTITVSKS